MWTTNCFNVGSILNSFTPLRPTFSAENVLNDLVGKVSASLWRGLASLPVCITCFLPHWKGGEKIRIFCHYCGLSGIEWVRTEPETLQLDGGNAVSDRARLTSFVQPFSLYKQNIVECQISFFMLTHFVHCRSDWFPARPFCFVVT